MSEARPIRTLPDGRILTVHLLTYGRARLRISCGVDVLNEY